MATTWAISAIWCRCPGAEAAEAAGLEPDYWTVFSENKATEAAAAAHRAGQVQRLLVRVFAEGDTFYPGHEGGVALDDLSAMIDRLAGLPGAEFAGLTTFPALLFDHDSGRARLTPNAGTLARAAEIAKGHPACPQRLEVNAPGTTSTEVLGLLAEAGATQVEPGHGLMGTTPLHGVQDLPEQTAVLYLSEVAHIHQGVALCFGGGLYIDPVFGDYQVHAVVAHDPSEVSTEPVPVDMPAPAAIDYYARLHPTSRRAVAEGATVVFGFRVQAFVTPDSGRGPLRCFWGDSQRWRGYGTASATRSSSGVRSEGPSRCGLRSMSRVCASPSGRCGR